MPCNHLQEQAASGPQVLLTAWMPGALLRIMQVEHHPLVNTLHAGSGRRPSHSVMIVMGKLWQSCLSLVLLFDFLLKVVHTRALCACQRAFVWLVADCRCNVLLRVALAANHYQHLSPPLGIPRLTTHASTKCPKPINQAQLANGPQMVLVSSMIVFCFFPVDCFLYIG